MEPNNNTNSTAENAAEDKSYPLDAPILQHNLLTMKIKNALLSKAKEAVDKDDFATATHLINATFGLSLIS